ncbi:radical SAM protein [Myxococcota bacterium]|nr:radical SAM protein [Myxococcota bacterium]
MPETRWPTPAPLDHPTPARPWRLYFALTNHCNRACPWCSTCSDPGGGTFLDEARFAALLPDDQDFEVQLEGGEPTVHPRFDAFVALARAHPRCRRLVVCTNGVRLPRVTPALRAWLAALGRPLTLKLSVNHHLVERDPGLLDLCERLRDLCLSEGEACALVINLRRRPGVANDDAALREALAARGLLPLTNDFPLQRYGYAADRAEWAEWGEPFAVTDRFTLVNPDGTTHGADLVGRSEAMRRLTRSPAPPAPARAASRRPRQ